MPTTQASDRELLVRIDERVAALQAVVLELKKDVKEKADATRLTKLESRVTKNDRKLSYICGGFVVLEALLKFVKLPAILGH